MEKKILLFFATLDSGGAENRMMDVYRCINTDVVEIDFAVLHEGKHYFDDEIKERGACKYVFSHPRKGIIKNYLELVHFFRKHSYDVVHTHVAWYGGVVLCAAKKAGVKVRIAHARDSEMPNRTFKKKLACGIGKVLINYYATKRIAISKEAAENIFGNRIVAKNQYLFVPNSIDEKKYTIKTEEQVISLRKELCIPKGKKAYVTIANLREQKNHMFLLEIAKELKNKKHDYILYLVGEGSLREQIQNRIIQLDLQDNVILMGSRTDVPQILCAFDAMIFPSLFEGLGGVILEAQLVGVPSIVSNHIPKVVDVGIGMVEYVSLEKSPSVWAERVINKAQNTEWSYDRASEAFNESGYCIEGTVRRYLREYGMDEISIEKALL